MKESVNISDILPTARLGTTPVLTAESKLCQSLADWRQIAADYPRNLCIHQLFEAQVEHLDKAVALESSAGRLTYRELNERANQLAHRLRSLGVGTETLVGVHVDRSIEFVVSILGILKAGGAYVPLDTEYPPERLQFLLTDSGVPVVISDQKLPQELNLRGITLVDLAAEASLIEVCPKFNLNSINTAEHLAYVIYTSGSTGQPKGVAIPHRGVVRLVRGQNYAEFDGGQRFLMLASTSFDAATFELWGPLLNGAVCVVFPKQPLDLQRLEVFIRRHQVTCLWLTAGLFNQIVSFRPSVLETVRHVLAGGDALSAAHVQKAMELLPTLRLTNGYGPTESTTFACCHAIKRGEVFPNGSVPIGRPIAHTHCYLLDDQLARVPPGVPAELYLGGDGLARGYWNRPELTAEKFIADPFSVEPGARLYKTGDLVRCLPDGNLEFLGRIDQQVKIRGFRIEPGEIESALGRHPAVCECVVVARQNPAGEKDLAAYVVVRPEPAPTVAELREFLLKKLPDYMIPSAFVKLEKLPLTPNGKVDRKALPAPDMNRLESGVEFVLPQTPTERALAKICKELLGVKQVGLHDNFFALGGHSLMAVRMVFRIHDALGVDLLANAVLQSPTIAELSAVVDRAAKGETKKSVQTRPASLLRPGPGLPAMFPVSFNQQQLWFIDQLDPANSVYNIPLVIRFKGKLKPEALQKSLNHLIHRHEALRTIFQAENGEPVQVIMPELVLKLPVVDLASCSEAERETEAQRLKTNAAGQRFDLNRGPLLWAELLCLGKENHVLMVTIHHIVFDGWSVDVFLRELMAGYAAFCEGEEPRLPELPVQYGDFAVWQRQSLRDDVLKDQLSYWKRRLGGNLPVLELPADYPRPAVQTFRGAEEVALLPKALADRLQKLSQQESATLFMTLLAALNVLLHRYTALEDVIVGSPSVTRNHAETEGLIGFFVNVLVLRTDASGDPSFTELLRHVRKVCLEAYAHQDVPFEKLVEHLQPERRRDRNPLFQVMLNLLGFPDFQRDLPDLKVELVAENGLQSKFDLTLYATPTNDGIRLNLVYNADLFSRGRMAEMLNQFKQLLELLVDQPDEKISQFSLVTPAARSILPDPTAPLPAEWPGSIISRFSAQAQRVPSRMAVADTKEQWSYHELEARSNQLAHYLRAQSIQAGDLVAIYAHRSASLVWALLGVWKARAAFVILDPSHPASRLIECLRLAKPKAWLKIAAAGPLPELLAEFAGQLKCRLELPGRTVAEARNFLGEYPRSTPEVAVDPGDLAYIAFTSGSTGAPKGIMGAHRPLSHFFQWHVRQFGLTDSDRFSMLSGLSHDPLIRDVFTPLWLGATLCIPEPAQPWDPQRLVAWLKAENISVIHVVPSFGQLLVESGGRDQLPALRHVFFGGEILRRQLVTKIQALAPMVTCVNFYGATETPQGMGYYIFPAGIADERQGADANQSERVPVGKGIEGVQLLVLNSAGKLAGMGEMGQICVRTPYLSDGYLGNDMLTREQFCINPYTGKAEDRCYRTGDVGRYLPDGNVELLGRNDAQVKIRGYRVELGDIEAVLARHQHIVQVAVLAQDDFADGKNLVACLVTREGTVLTADELRTFLQQHLPDYMIPSMFVNLEKLPLTPNGKVDQKALLALDLSLARHDLSEQADLPKNSFEMQMLLIWQRVLNLKTVGIRDNFFDLGGHSLLAVRLVSEINKSLSLSLSIPIFFQNPTIEGIIRALETENHRKSEPKLVSLQPGPPGRALFFLDASMGQCQLAQLLDAGTASFATIVPLPASVLRAAALNDENNLPSLEELAAAHAMLIQKHQPSGLCLLAGHSFGGVLAFEVAHQLQRQGRTVEMILLLDSWVAAPPWWRKLKVLSLARAWNSLQFRVSHWWSQKRNSAAGVPRSAEAALEVANQPIGNVPWEIFQRIYRQARKKYQFRPLDSRAIVFRAQHDEMATFYAVSNKLGWDGLLTHGIEVVETPGDHFTLLKEPNLQVLAGHFKERLKQP